MKPKAIKVLEENIKKNFFTLVKKNIFRINTTSMIHKRKTDKLYFIKIKNQSAKNSAENENSNRRLWENIYKSHI